MNAELNFFHSQFGVMKADDLWTVLTEQAQNRSVIPSNVTIKEIMDTWTLQSGYPVVNVMRNYNESTLTLSQVN